MSDADLFERLRAELTGLAYRMLGDLAAAEDVVQEAWLRWSRGDAHVESPRSFLATVVTRLCLNELASARFRREQARGDRLPEPVDLRTEPLRRLEALDDVSMAFVVLLQRLAPAERAVLLLHDIFDFDYPDVSRLVGKSEVACRQILHRAHEHVRDARRAFETPPAEQRRALDAFLRAAMSGDRAELARALAADAVLIADAGPDGGTFGGARELGRPLVGAAKIAAFVASIVPRGAAELSVRPYDLNGQPAMLLLRGDELFAVILVSVADGRIHSVFVQADPARLRRLAATLDAADPVETLELRDAGVAGQRRPRST